MPLATAHEIVDQADRVTILVEARIDNTLSHPYFLEDALCGNVGLSGNEINNRIVSNSDFSVSNIRVPQKATNLILGGEVQLTRSIGEPFESSVSSVSFANFEIKNEEGIEDFENRFFEDSFATIKVGGLVK